MITHETLQRLHVALRLRTKFPKRSAKPLGLSSSSVPQATRNCTRMLQPRRASSRASHPMQLFTPRGFLVFCFLLEDSDHSLHSVNSPSASGSDLRETFSDSLNSNRSHLSTLFAALIQGTILHLSVSILHFIYNITFISVVRLYDDLITIFLLHYTVSLQEQGSYLFLLITACPAPGTGLVRSSCSINKYLLSE